MQMDLVGGEEGVIVISEQNTLVLPDLGLHFSRISSRAAGTLGLGFL